MVRWVHSGKYKFSYAVDFISFVLCVCGDLPTYLGGGGGVRMKEYQVKIKMRENVAKNRIIQGANGPNGSLYILQI